MGNCALKGISMMTRHGISGDKMVKVVTSNGGIMELYTPITADFITTDFPGHAIFHSRVRHRDDAEPQPQPLPENEELRAGEVYFLLPLNNYATPSPSSLGVMSKSSSRKSMLTRQESNDKSISTKMGSDPEISLRHLHNNKSSSSGPGGVWKVRLVISPEHLSEILSEESLTEALIESLRTVAKCSNSNRVPNSPANSGHFKYIISY